MTSDEIFLKTLMPATFYNYSVTFNNLFIIHDMPGMARCVGYEITWVKKMDECAEHRAFNVT